MRRLIFRHQAAGYPLWPAMASFGIGLTAAGMVTLLVLGAFWAQQGPKEKSLAIMPSGEIAAPPVLFAAQREMNALRAQLIEEQDANHKLARTITELEQTIRSLDDKVKGMGAKGDTIFNLHPGEIKAQNAKPLEPVAVSTPPDARLTPQLSPQGERWWQDIKENWVDWWLQLHSFRDVL